MKRIIISAILVIMLYICSISVFSLEYTSPVEISFRVGDSTLCVNGTDVTVETPYIVGDGVTLVPVRVITEAFGATVKWDGSERSVTLIKDDLKIKIYIDKIQAQINDKECQLLSAPELTNSVTMVPLRFISENFGASVLWDNETKRIFVTKEGEPIIEHGMKLYENEDIGLTMCIPDDLYLKENSLISQLDFISQDRKDFNCNSVLLYTGVKEDIQSVAEKDRENQLLSVNEEKFYVTKVELQAFNGIDTYVYEICPVGTPMNASPVVTKAFFNHGSYSYMSLTYTNSDDFCLDIIRNEQGHIDSIGGQDVEISFPSKFQKDKQLYDYALDTFSDEVENVKLKIFKNSTDFKLDEYYEDNQIVMLSKGSETGYVLNDVSDCSYNFMGEEVSAKTYTIPYSGGFVRRFVCFEHNGYVFDFDISSYDEERIDYVIENTQFIPKNDDLISEYKSKNEDVYNLNSNNSQKISVSDFEFRIPDSFEVIKSKDSKLFFAMDKENGFMLTVVVKAASIDDDTYIKGFYNTVPNYVNGGFPVNNKVRKLSVCDTMLDTEQGLKSFSWYEASYSSRLNKKGGLDYTKYRKDTNGSSVFQDIYNLRTDLKLLEDRQSVHAFVFSYDFENHTLSNMKMRDAIINSITVD